MQNWGKRKFLEDLIHFYSLFNIAFIHILVARSKRGADLWGLSNVAIKFNLRIITFLEFPLLPRSRTLCRASLISSMCLDLIYSAASFPVNTLSLATIFLVFDCCLARSCISFLCSRRVFVASSPTITLVRLAVTK